MKNPAFHYTGRLRLSKLLPKGEWKWRDAGQLSRLAECARPYRVRLSIALAGMSCATAMGLAMPQAMRVLIDAAFVLKDSHRLNQAMLMLLGVFTGQAIFSFLRSYLLAYVGESVVADLRTRLYDHITGLSLSFFADRQVGALMSRLTSDVTVVQSLITSTLSELLRQGLTLIGTIAIVTVTNPRLTLAMLAVVPVMMVSVMIYGAYLRRVSTRVQDALAGAGAVLHESLSAMHIVQSFVREDYERQRYRGQIQIALRLAIRRALATGGFTGFTIMVVLGGMSMVVWYGSRMVIAGQLTAGNLSAFLMYMVVLAFSIGGISELYGSLQSALGSCQLSSSCWIHRRRSAIPSMRTG